MFSTFFNPETLKSLKIGPILWGTQQNWQQNWLAVWPEQMARGLVIPKFRLQTDPNPTAQAAHRLGYLQNCHRILQKSPAFIIIISSSSHPQMATFRSQIRGATDGEDRFLAKAGLGAGQEICW